MRSYGQASLEYLIVASAFFACLLLFAPAINSIYSAAIFGLDVAGARNFMHSICASADMLSVLGAGSSAATDVQVLGLWQSSASNGKLSVTVYSPDSNLEKELGLECSQLLNFPAVNLQGNYALTLTRCTGKISVVDCELNID